jgi:hypothetical protein
VCVGSDVSPFFTLFFPCKKKKVVLWDLDAEGFGVFIEDKGVCVCVCV